MTMSQENIQVFSEFLIEAGSTLFQTLGVTLVPIAPPCAPQEPVGVRASLAFDGSDLCGVIVLEMSAALVARLHPDPTPGLAELRDWVGELNNLMVGGLKSTVLTRGAVLECATPLTAPEAPALRTEGLRSFQFAAENGRVDVFFTAAERRSLDLTEIGEDAYCAVPGEPLFF